MELMQGVVMFYLFIVIALLTPVLHLLIIKPAGSTVVYKIFLKYGLFALAGLSGLYAFMGHAFVPNQVAAYIGWPAGSPFQFEVACANLAMGVLGIVSLWRGPDFWLAAIFGQGIFLLGDAYGHIHDMLLHHNYAPGNAGIVLYLDIGVPFYLLLLWLSYTKQAKMRGFVAGIETTVLRDKHDRL